MPENFKEISQKYPKIKDVCRVLGHDTGCINRSFSEERFLEKIMVLIVNHFDEDLLVSIETFLATLSQEDLEVLAMGEIEEDLEFELEHQYLIKWMYETAISQSI